MNINQDCVACILNQVEKTLTLLAPEERITSTIRGQAHEMSKSFSFAHTPPWVAREVYEMIARETGLEDPLAVVKQKSIELATSLLPDVYLAIEKSSDPLFSAIKASAAGNVIDFGAKEQFDLEEEIAKVFDTPFAVDEYEAFQKKLQSSDSLLMLADNAGENVFDKVLLETIKRLYPTKSLYYATRGKAIINDITTKEAYQIGIDEVATILDTGVDTPGLEAERASDAFWEMYQSAPLVLAKGMGNYECLENGQRDLFFLFKVKCNVVANSIKQEVGSLIFSHKEHTFLG
jgi:damage-control phosphatase, subfamily I